MSPLRAGVALWALMHVAAAAGRVGAQLPPTPVGATRSATDEMTAPSAYALGGVDARPRNGAERFLARTVGGVVGLPAGAIAGGYAAAALGPDEGEYFPTHVVAGVLAGGVLLSAALAAAPSWQSHCSYGQRMLRGTLGVLAGTAGGVAVAAAASSGAVALFSIPLGSGLGAAAALSPC